MTKLEITTLELDRMDAFNGELNPQAMLMTKILDKDIPLKMAYTIATFTMSSFLGHFQPKIKMAADNLVPPNMIAFILAKSGAKKTSSMLNLEKSLQCGYEILNNKRLEKAKIIAQELETEMRPLNPLANALATEAGMILRLNDFHGEGLGLPALFVDEIATELATNIDMIPNIKLVSQLFDVGEMKSKPLKDREQQSEEVHGMGMTALFIGSEHSLLEDDAILKKFDDEFISKLARRCYFVYPEFEKEENDYSIIDELLDELDKEQTKSNSHLLEMNKLSAKIAIKFIDEDLNIIEISKEAMRLYKVYKIFCEEKAEDITNEPLHLEQKHRHWKAFKLAGVFSVFNENEEITFDDLRQAINTAELTAPDLELFLNKAKRATYEVVVEYFLNNGKPLTIHEMIKLGWIKKIANLKDMLINANSKLGNQGKIEEYSGKISYAEFEQLTKNKLNASFKILPPLAIDKYLDRGLEYPEAKKKAKDERGHQIVDGYVYKATTFDKLANLLCNDCAYTPFKFKDKMEGAQYNTDKYPNPKGGIRGKDNIDSGAEFIVLDVDDADITIDEAFDMLQDYQFLMALTSDPNNIYKFRVIMPIDVVIRIERGKWKLFMDEISKHLGIKIDLLPQSQIYYGFKDRTVLINKEGELLEASDLLKQIASPEKVITMIPTAQRASVWNDRRNEFAYAYNATSGSGLHLTLFKAMRHAYDLGFPLETNIALTQDIENYREDAVRPSYSVSLKSQRDALYAVKSYD